MRDKDAAADLPADSAVRARMSWRTLIAGAVVGACAGLLFTPAAPARFEARLAWEGALPAPRDWPQPAASGENVRLSHGITGDELCVTAPTAAAARALARGFIAVQTPGSPEFSARLAARRRSWRRALGAGPLPSATRPTQVAALLLARARWGSALAGEFPELADGPEVPEPTPPAAVIASARRVHVAAATLDPAVVAHALREAAAYETHWFLDDAAWSAWPRAARAEAWRRWQLARATLLEASADRALERQTMFQRRLARAWSREYLVGFDAHAGASYLAFGVPDPREVRPLVYPMVSVWAPPLAAGAAAGVLLAAFALWFATWLRPSLPAVRLLARAGAPADPAAAGPRLHVVSGSTSSAVLRAALELAAHRVALGERVLLVDGSAQLRLHERLGRDARWGLLECLAADMPMLGLVQYAGHPGLYLLPHGNAERSVGWSSLGRKLDEVVPHFGRIVLALDPRSPEGVGDAVRGRAMEGWWAGADKRADAAADLATAHFGIVFQGLDLADFPEASLEVLAERVLALRPPGPPPEAAPITARALPPVPASVLEPIVLDCDLQVRQRLRSLAWMRRVRSQNRRAEVQAHT